MVPVILCISDYPGLLMMIMFYYKFFFQAHNMEVPKAILENFNVIEEQALELFLSIQCGLAHKRY